MGSSRCPACALRCRNWSGVDHGAVRLDPAGQLEQFKGGGDQVVVQVACIDIGRFRGGRNRLGIAPQIVAEHILVAAILLGLIQGPVRVFEQLVKGIAAVFSGRKQAPMLQVIR